MGQTLAGLRKNQQWKWQDRAYTLEATYLQWLDGSPIVLLASDTEPEGGWWIGINRLHAEGQLLKDAPSGTPDMIAEKREPPTLRSGEKLLR